ncbi:MAG: RNA polymerase factor sigma-54 [Nitrospinae bacterium]|nr:RNA polymerase factor sigma-54 [Nitrospinota bacterium]
MGMEMKLQMRLSQRLVMTPMLQQAIKLLPMTRLELVQAIRQELEENPMLDELLEDDQEQDAEREERDDQDDESDPGDNMVDTLDRQDGVTTDPPETKFEEDSSLGDKNDTDTRDEIDWDAYSQEDLYEGGTGEGYEERPSLDNTLKQGEGLESHLMWQLSYSAVTDEERRLGEIIIGNLNDEGYLASDLASLADAAGVSTEAMEDALILVQSFDPAGVAARDLKECLLIQVIANGFKGSIVHELVRDHLEHLDERNFPKLAKQLDYEIDDIVDAIRTIREFDPKPGLPYSSEAPHYITPDLFVVKVDDDYQVFLNDEGMPRLRINPVYQTILKNKDTRSETEKQTREYLDNKYRSALWMIKSIEQRRQTMLKVGRSLCTFQREFLDKGINYLKPLILKDVADDIGMHESTISRVTTNKYIHTPQGLFELKFFFHSSVGSYLGNDMSSVRVKEMIKQLVKDEDSAKPLTDDQIVAALMAKDVKIARRTVTKYRKELNISSTSKRRKLYL